MRNRFAVAGLMSVGFAVLAFAGVFRAEPTIASEEGVSVTSEPQSEVDAFLAAVERVSPVVNEPFGPDGGVTSDQVAHSFSVPADAPVRQFRFFNGRQYDEGTEPGGRGVPELVYSNTGSTNAYTAGQFASIADDARTTATCGCELTSYTVRVAGGGDGSGTFLAVVDLYDDCPSNGGAAIPGMQAIFTDLADDGVFDLTVDAVTPTSINRTVWPRVAFSTETAGWLRGVPPEIGVSADVYNNPFAGCGAIFTGLYASFYAQLYCAPITGPGVPGTPVPEDGAVDAPPDTQLAWDGGSFSRAPGTLEGVPFDDGTLHPDEFAAKWEEVIASGEVPDPREQWRLPPPPSDRQGGGARGFVPTVTRDDLFLFEDTFDVLATGFSFGDLVNLMDSSAQALVAEHGGEFDFIAFWLNFNVHGPSRIGGAFYSGFFNDVTGIGLGMSNGRASHGLSGTNVSGYVMMYSIYDWSLRGAITRLVLGQEFEHRFGMFLLPLNDGRSLQGDNGSCGRSAHWNFNVDGQASGMEIREWTGSSPANRLSGTLNYNTDIGGNAVFSYPDLYLMGVVSPEEMDTLSSELRFMGRTDADNPTCATPYNGTISTWGSADVALANGGPRFPSSLSAKKDYRTGWVMFHRPGSPPSFADLDRAVDHLNDWTEVYGHSTLGRGTMNNTLIGDICSISYDVFFGTTNPPTNLICEATSDHTCDPGTLVCGQTYFWQVVAHKAELTEEGPVWSFAAGGTTDCNNNGTADACEIADGSALDCNGNGIPDECDLAGPTSDDCNGNGIPDECDVAGGESDCQGDGVPDTCQLTPDCNSNGIPDDCEADCQPNGTPDDCDISSGASDDCQPNDVPDECDIAGGGSADDNANSVPDECETATFIEPTGAGAPHDVEKNRYISFNPNNDTTEVAFQVTLSDGRKCWVGEPCLRADTGNIDPQWVAECVESSAGDGSDMLRDWSSYTDPATGNPVVHVRGCVILPNETYDVRTTAGGGVLSAPLTIATVPAPTISGSWADIVGAFDTGTGKWNAPDSNTGFLDIAAGVQGFQKAGTAPVTWTDLVSTGTQANYIVGFDDIGAIIAGFQAIPYPGAVATCAIPATADTCP